MRFKLLCGMALVVILSAAALAGAFVRPTVTAAQVCCTAADCCPECAACCALDGGCPECDECCIAMGCDPCCTASTTVCTAANCISCSK
jgi:hypothetical protein